MKNIFKFNGRISRLEYFGIFVVVNIVAIIVDYLSQRPSPGLVLFATIFIICIWLWICTTIKRFHDLGRSGYEAFTLLIPLYNIYPGLILLFKKGTIGANTYGEDPLGNTNVLDTKKNNPVETKQEDPGEEKWWQGWS